MKFINLTPYTVERQELERLALAAVCACYYYDLADAIDGMDNEELEHIIAGSHNTCASCS